MWLLLLYKEERKTEAIRSFANCFNEDKGIIKIARTGRKILLYLNEMEYLYEITVRISRIRDRRTVMAGQ